MLLRISSALSGRFSIGGKVPPFFMPKIKERSYRFDFKRKQGSSAAQRVFGIIGLTRTESSSHRVQWIHALSDLKNSEIAIRENA